MQRNSLFTKLFAMVLCVAMAICCLPFGAFAADDWEGEIDEIEKGPEKFDLAGAYMTLGNSLAINYVVNTSKLENGGEGHYAVITRHYGDGRPDDVVTIPKSEWAAYSGSNMRITYNGIAAKEMGDIMEVVFYNAKGQAVTNTWTDSIRGYAMRQLNNKNNASKTELLICLVDMLNYGAAAQLNFGYCVEDLANNQLTAAQAALATAEAKGTNILEKGTGYAGAMPALESEILYSFVFYNSVMNNKVSECYAEITFTTHGGTKTTYVVEGEDFTAYSSTMSRIYVTGLAVADVDTEITCVIKDASGNQLSYVKDSLGGYLQRAIDNKTATEVFVALLKFGNSAYNYFH